MHRTPFISRLVESRRPRTGNNHRSLAQRTAQCRNVANRRKSVDVEPRRVDIRGQSRVRTTNLTRRWDNPHGQLDPPISESQNTLYKRKLLTMEQTTR